jgi:hypothetical protein
MLRFLGWIFGIIWFLGMWVPSLWVQIGLVFWMTLGIWSLMFLGPSFFCFWWAKSRDAKRLANAIAGAMKKEVA